MLRIRVGLLLAFLVLADLAAFVVFLNGFFPVKRSVLGYADHSSRTEPEIIDLDDAPKADRTLQLPRIYDKVVLILIDALRADFVLPGVETDVQQMEYVKNLIVMNKTLSYTARAHPPTVTLPRIKAMTTGSIPGFIDVVMNFNTQSLQEDNIISQLHRLGQKIVFYGDDTWMKLYPEHFVRTDGTTSFFVTDYTEVDYNVTRHLSNELIRHDWDLLILHYLGLDHIGHLAGPYSPLIKPKLQEMDTVIKRVLEALATEYSDDRCLLLLCGDHGMSDQGSHGGSSLVETATPLIFLDPQWLGGKGQVYTGQTVDQIDMAATLALLLGVPIPQNNLGTIIVPMLNELDSRDKLRALYSNAKQLLMVMQENVRDYKREPSYHQLQRAQQSHISWIKTYISNPNSAVLNQLCVKVIQQYVMAMTAIREKLSGMLLYYDIHAMTAAIIVFFVVLLALVQFLNIDSGRVELFPSKVLVISTVLAIVIIFVHLSICTSQMASSSLCSIRGSLVIMFFIIVSIIGTSVWLISNGFEIFRKCRLLPVMFFKADILHKLLVCGTMCHTITLLSSSFVEEEHQTWYFLTVSLHIIYIWKVYTCVYSITDCHDIREDTSDMAYVTDADIKGGIYLNSDMMLKLSERKEKLHSHKRIQDNKILMLLYSIAFLILCRLARAWNQTGDKWAHLPDIGDWLICPENINVLSLVAAISMISTFLHVYISSRSHLAIPALFILGSAGVYCFRTANRSFLGLSHYEMVSKGVFEARCVYTVLVLMLCYTFYKSLSSGHHDNQNVSHHFTKDHPPDTNYDQQYFSTDPYNKDASRVVLTLRNIWADIQSAWILLMLLILRPHNIALVAIVTWQEYIIRHITRKTLVLNLMEVILMYYWMGQAGFYYQGNSNSISTVDVSAGYIGLESYNPVIITFLMAASTYAMPVYWLISAVRIICDIAVEQSWTTSRLKQALLKLMTVLAICRALPIAVYSVLVTAERYHLFVWTVFSPKLLYEGMNTVIVTVFILLVAVIERHIPLSE